MVVDGRDKLLVFLTRRDIEPTNNVSERALRPSVIFRKVTNGFRSAWGAKVYADICSVVATGRIHGQSPLASLRAALATARHRVSRRSRLIKPPKGVSSYPHWRNPRRHRRLVVRLSPDPSQTFEMPSIFRIDKGAFELNAGVHF
ncbi:transposase [Rhodoplanes sp. SY1]|uniref:IS66 family transposase n=1 Tax=Rhodoplanes sp. SY1 TaxID=3166646 RepID=UPI0038B4CED7